MLCESCRRMCLFPRRLGVWHEPQWLRVCIICIVESVTRCAHHMVTALRRELWMGIFGRDVRFEYLRSARRLHSSSFLDLSFSTGLSRSVPLCPQSIVEEPRNEGSAGVHESSSNKQFHSPSALDHTFSPLLVYLEMNSMWTGHSRTDSSTDFSID